MHSLKFLLNFLLISIGLAIDLLVLDDHHL